MSIGSGIAVLGMWMAIAAISFSEIGGGVALILGIFAAITTIAIATYAAEKEECNHGKEIGQPIRKSV